MNDTANKVIAGREPANKLTLPTMTFEGEGMGQDVDEAPEQGVTGRDEFIIAKALAYAVAHIDGLPPKRQEWSDRNDMAALFRACVPEGVQAHIVEGIEDKTGVRPDMTDHKRYDAA